MGKKLQKPSYKLHFINSATFVASSLPNSVDIFAEEIYKIKCNYEHHS